MPPNYLVNPFGSQYDIRGVNDAIAAFLKDLAIRQQYAQEALGGRVVPTEALQPPTQLLTDWGFDPQTDLWWEDDTFPRLHRGACYMFAITAFGLTAYQILGVGDPLCLSTSFEPPLVKNSGDAVISTILQLSCPTPAVWTFTMPVMWVLAARPFLLRGEAREGGLMNVVAWVNNDDYSDMTPEAIMSELFQLAGLPCTMGNGEEETDAEGPTHVERF